MGESLAQQLKAKKENDIRSVMNRWNILVCSLALLRRSIFSEPFAMVWINQALVRGLERNWAFGVIRIKDRFYSFGAERTWRGGLTMSAFGAKRKT
jgi:hypothetical protein